MNPDDTRESRADRSVGGGTHSHEDLYPPNSAGQELSQELRQHHPAPIEATAPVHETQVTTALSDAQRDVFWAGIVANLDSARRVAKRIVTRENVDDVVHSGAVCFIESLEGPDASPFPATNGDLRALFLDIVRRYAVDCVRDCKRPPLQTHSNWGMEWQPVVRGHNVPDRELGSVFTRNDDGKYDTPAATTPREQDNVEQLRHILDRHLDKLSQARREILVESSFGEGKRADIAARRGITVSTYDNHRQAAFKALRESLAAEVEASTGKERSVWYDRIEELIKLRAARLRDRSSSEKDRGSTVGGKGSSAGGKGGSSRGKGASSEDEHVNVEGARANSRGERRDAEAERRAVRAEGGAVRGEGRAVTPERANAAHQRDGDQHKADADAPVADQSSGARNNAERPRPRIVSRSLQGGGRTRLHTAGNSRSAA